MDLILKSNSLCFLCFSGDQMADYEDDVTVSEEELSDSSPSNSNSEDAVEPSTENSEETEDGSPEFSGQEWAAPEPRDTCSLFTAQPQWAFVEIGDPNDWRIHIPAENERICSDCGADKFGVYEYVFKEMGLRLPFSDFQMSVLNHLDLAPSQLHPNSFAFIRAFELTCEYLNIGATLPLFFNVFHLQRQAVQGKFGWVSLKQVRKLFKAFSESIRTFKNRYFFVEPMSARAEEYVYTWEVEKDDRGRPVLDEHGEVVKSQLLKFRFSWSNEHFQRKSDDYVTNPSLMSEEDQESYRVLTNFVDSFVPAQRVTRAKKLVFEEDGSPAVVPRYICCAQLLACPSHEEAMKLLGIYFTYARYDFIY